jgi:hypothetical protein
MFVRSGSTWTQEAELTASDGVANDEFGTWVAISGSTAVIGSMYNNFQRGAAYVFVRSGTTWIQQAKLTAADATKNDLFAYPVAIFGSTAVVGAVYLNSLTGAAYVYVVP